MISRGLKQGAGRAKLRKMEKTNGLNGLKTGSGRANLRKIEKPMISKGYNRKQGGPT